MALRKCIRCSLALLPARIPRPPASIRCLASLPLDMTAPANEGVCGPNTESPLENPDYFGVHSLVSMEDLLRARVHLGHKTGLWNTQMKRFIHGSRAGIHILDLDQTLPLLHTALNVTAHIAYRGGIVLFVNERPQYEGFIQRTARDCGEYFITQKWRGGTLTNSFMLLGTLRLPDLVIFTSVPPSKTAIRETAMSCIPSVGIVDSDCDPSQIMYPVPGNDDSPSAIRLYCELFSRAILLGKERRQSDKSKIIQAKSDDAEIVQTETNQADELVLHTVS